MQILMLPAKCDNEPVSTEHALCKNHRKRLATTHETQETDGEPVATSTSRVSLSGLVVNSSPK
jgi:hypothetical protein